MLGNRIDDLIKSTGLNNVKIANKLGVSKVAVGKWRKGQSEPTGSNLSGLAEVLKTNADFLLTGKQGDLFYDDLSQSRVVGWDDETELEDDEFEIPYYNKVTVTAGSQEGEVQEVTGKTIRMSKSSARKAGASITQSFSYVNDGDSMAERISDGARCTADASKKEIKDGKIYCLRHGVMRRTKYLYRRPDGGLLIRSHNPNYPDEIIAPEDMNDIEILGWVWEWSNMERW
ncbi:S24 family peptidase [Psychrobacter sp. T6-6]|uniref:S24 family peptidase n=1 Tax=Psychrobacter sp. T6-6 TaxID=3457452 RepID=UPI003FD5EF61